MLPPPRLNSVSGTAAATAASLLQLQLVVVSCFAGVDFCLPQNRNSNLCSQFGSSEQHLISQLVREGVGGVGFLVISIKKKITALGE